MQIRNKIYTIRNKQVMLDSDLAELYIVETKTLNQAVKRNKERFPDKFMFQLTSEEFNDLRSQFVTANLNISKKRFLPYVFTEQGIAMLSGVLRSKIAIDMSIKIMDAFVEMRRFLLNNASVFQRFEQIDYKLMLHDKDLDKIFEKISQKEVKSQGIFYDGQIFDAYSFVIKLIKEANREIVLIDNYIDESTLILLSSNKDVKIKIYTRSVSKQLSLGIDKYNRQYGNLEINLTDKFHDMLKNHNFWHLMNL